MTTERSILCGDVSAEKLSTGDEEVVRLSSLGPQRNINLHFDDIRRYLFKDIPPRLKDLLGIATYVYCADQAVSRGRSDVESLGDHWRRNLHFRIAVREPDFWNAPKVIDALTSTLGFLSDDQYQFEFVGSQQEEHLFDLDFNFFKDNSFLGNPERVVMFSGGLDSLGGAVQEAVVDRRKVALINHRPTSKLNTRHRYLQELLSKHAPATAPIHIHVSINKDKELGKDYTQRSRSFLYASLGATIAEMLGLSSIYFYENGIVSLNLPPCGQVVGARATRTTHPKVIEGFSNILSLVADRTFKVENPFLWKTKGEIVELIAKAGCSEMIAYSTSCTHTWEMTKLYTHCGTCSQCIDRRFAVLAAGQGAYDPEVAYKIDLLTGERDKDEHRTMLATYVETANDVQGMGTTEFFSWFGEASRVLRHIDGTPESTAQRVFDLHKRHAAEVTKVIDDGLSRHAAAIRKRELPPSSLLRLVCDSAAAGTATQKVGDASNVGKQNALSGKLGDNAFRKTGRAWEVRFAGGQPFILLPSKGAAYLHILFTNPRTVFRVTDLVFQVAKAPADYILGDAGPILEKDVLATYRAKHGELQESLAEAEQNNDLGQQAKLRSDIEWLEGQVKQAVGLGGRTRKLADDRDRVRKSFRAAIRRAVEEIAKYDKTLADHLKPPRLTCGWNPSYDPAANIVWDV